MSDAVKADISTDYLVIGAGINGLSFVDELVTRTSASITIIDKRDVPGGHWNDAYPFVKLHQPSSFYGVQSKELSNFQIDASGPNKGLESLATGPEVVAYCHSLMRDRLVPSGRVTYLPSTELQPDGTIRRVLSGKQLTINVKKRVVDATWYTNTIPLNHRRAFAVAPSVTCIPPNHLPRLASGFTRFTVLGAGKTAVDACTWLLQNGVEPSHVRWIFPNDYWYINRAKTQSRVEYFSDMVESVIEARNTMGHAKNATEVALGYEKCGMWHRLDPNILPHRIHGAVVSPGEMQGLRTIKDVVRQGRVTSIESDSITLTSGSVSAHPETLYIDCTASAIAPRPLVPIFQPGKIVLQLVRYPQIPFSAALTAFMESLDMDDDERNSVASPVGFRDTVDDLIISLGRDMQNRVQAAQHPEILKWMRSTRLEGTLAFMKRLSEKDEETVALMTRMKKASRAAGMNYPKLLASTKNHASL